MASLVIVFGVYEIACMWQVHEIDLVPSQMVHCFYELDTLPSLFSTGRYQERHRAVS